METSGPTSGIPRIASTPTVTPAQWRVGQVLQATVADTGVGKALLAIGNRQVSAETSLALQKGEQLMLQVRELGAKPLLRVVAATTEPVLATAIRELLPKQGGLTPLLASIGQLTRTPNAPLPPLMGQLLRSIVTQIPDARTASSAAGLQQAIARSGIFLERQLYRARVEARPVTLEGDFKANLLRLIQLVRNWPGSPAPAPAGGAPVPAPKGTATTPAPPPAGTPPPATAPDPARDTTGTAAPSRGPVQTAPTASGTTLSPAQLARAVRAGTATPQASTSAGGSPGGMAPGMAGPNPGAQDMRSPGLLPPPLPGTQPVAQPAVQASLDLLNRLGSLRTDLLQQSEAALARLQLHQLAALPREGERGLLEWLFELPIRHEDAIDLWSLRIARERGQEPQDDSKKDASWSVQLAFDLPGLGPVQARVQLRGEKVSTRFWVEQAQTLPLLRDHLHELRRALGAVGLEVGELDCQPGSPTADPSHPHPPLFSEKA